MKATKWMAALAAVGSIGIVTSQAAAIVCRSPGLGFFDDIVQSNGNGQSLEVSCLSQPTGGSISTLRGRGSSSGIRVRANLTEGSGYAYAGAYGTNRAPLGCSATDTNPTLASSAFMDCSATVGFVDVEIGN
jgi:hypothetical protein